jgi:hypothetical protein
MGDGCVQGITTGRVRATRHGAVESQSGQMRSHRAVNDVGGRLILARDGVQPCHVDKRDVRLSHTR